MFIAASYVIAKNWKQLAFSSTSEWTQKVVVYNIPLYNGLSLRNKTKQTTDTSRNLDGYQKHDAM